MQPNGRVLHLAEAGELEDVEVGQRGDGSIELLADERPFDRTAPDPAAQQAQRAAATHRSKLKPIVNYKVNKPSARHQITLTPRGGYTRAAPALREVG